MLGLSQTYIYRIESEALAPSEDAIRVFASVFAQDFDALMHLTGRMPTDCEAIVTSDPSMPAFLRWAAASGWTGTQLYAAMRSVELMGLSKGRPNGSGQPTSE